MAEYGLVDSFNIDDGSLAGQGEVMAFTLGVEWEMFRQKLLTGARLQETVHLENARRLVKMAVRHGRFVEHHRVADGWAVIVVGDFRKPA